MPRRPHAGSGKSNAAYGLQRILIIVGCCAGHTADTVYTVDMSTPPTPAQKKIASQLKIKFTGQSARVLAAQIIDRIEDDAHKTAAKLKLAPGTKVLYSGKVPALKHEVLTVASVTARGFVTFKGTKQFARPHNLKIA